MTRYTDYIQRKHQQYGITFDPSGLDPRFRPYFDSGQRIRIATDYRDAEGTVVQTYERTGIVGVTTGWRPAFLLKHRSNASGSSDLLGAQDRIVAVQQGRTYREVTSDADGNSR